MKFIKSNIIVLFISLMAFGLTGCKDADQNFVHTDNFVHAMVCENTRQNDAKSITGTIYEYDKHGSLLGDEFTAEDAEGGSGVVVFVVTAEDKKDFDLTDVYLRATLKFDAMVSPTLSGRHNILVDEEHPDGKVIAITSGIGTVRKYRIMGIYE